MLDNVDQMNEQSLPRGDLESLRWAKAGRKAHPGVETAISPLPVAGTPGPFPLCMDFWPVTASVPTPGSPVS